MVALPSREKSIKCQLVMKKQISDLLTKIRKLNFDEFIPQLTHGDTIDDLIAEIDFLEEKQNEEKKLREEIIDHLTLCMTENYFTRFPTENFKYEYQILSEGFNTFIEELEGNTINKKNFQHILNTLPQKIIIFDNDGFINFSNSEGENLFYDKKIEIYGDFYKLVNEDIKNNITDFKSTRLQKIDFEIAIHKTKKQTLYFDISLIKIHFIGKDQIMCIAKDITEQKNAELIALKAMITGQDLERKRLASDLHDSLGQELNAIKLYLGTLEILESNTPEYKKCINEINRMFNDTINSVREITFDLMPFILENNSISSAIEQLCKQLNSIHTIRINYISNVKKIGLKDKKDEAIVYRIIQEFINNSLKHSKATVINVELSKNKNEIKIQLNDNGVGFDLKKVARNNGLRNIQQRLEILNAEFHFTSEPNSTTNLTFTIYE